MREPATFLCQPVRSLQTMLQVLREQDSQYPQVIPDGIYGPQTMKAISYFQQTHGLPVTGVTDQATWETIVPQFERARIEVESAQPLELILNPNEVLRRNDESPNVFVLQAVLTVLSLAYSCISAPPQTGIMDFPTTDALSTFQGMSGLPMTGQLDKKTWQELALHYPLAANICTSRSNGTRKQ